MTSFSENDRIKSLGNVISSHRYWNKEQKIMKKTQIGKKITDFMIIFWMFTIFAFSAQPAYQSSKTSHSVSYKIAEWKNQLFHQEKTEEELYEEAESMQLLIRKNAHMGEYAFLAILLCFHFSYDSLSTPNLNLWRWHLKRLLPNSRKKQIIIKVLLITSGYAASDEFHQLFVPGRAGRLSDVCIDSLGGFLGIFFYFQVLNFRKIKHYRTK